MFLFVSPFQCKLNLPSRLSICGLINSYYAIGSELGFNYLTLWILLCKAVDWAFGAMAVTVRNRCAKVWSSVTFASQGSSLLSASSSGMAR